jgi:hypothetical protein
LIIWSLSLKKREKKDIESKIEKTRLTNRVSELEKKSMVIQNEILELNKKIEFILAKKELAEDGYTYMKNLNIQIIIDNITPKNQNIENQQQINTQNNGLIRLINLISKENEILNNKLEEKNYELEKIKNEKK